MRETATSSIAGLGVQHRPETFPGSAINSLRFHWPEYLMEAGEVTLYLFLTCLFAAALQGSGFPIRQLISSDIARRALMGLAVGATVTAIVMTPWGKQSGGHFNPAVTVAFCRLGKVALPDTLFYVVAQFLGAIAGVCIARYLLLAATGRQVVTYAVTMPGTGGSAIAFIAELTMSFLLMITILVASNREALARFTPYFVGFWYALFITFEAPFSGMSMNPARSFAPALHAGYWHALWLYLAAPTLGMLVAAEVFLRARGGLRPFCAKLHHANDKRCIFQHGTPSHPTKTI